MSVEWATASFRTESGVAEDKPWPVVDSAELSNTVPWRTFRWYKGQRHYSGMYWSATMRDHVIYESRLEMARLIFADFDRSVHRILAQVAACRLLAQRNPDRGRVNLGDFGWLGLRHDNCFRRGLSQRVSS